jgi:hypothetical protein
MNLLDIKIYDNKKVRCIYYYLDFGIFMIIIWYVYKKNFKNNKIYSYLKIKNKYMIKLGIKRFI